MCRQSGGDQHTHASSDPHPPKKTQKKHKTQFESGAILQYLADKFGGLDTPAARAVAAQWVGFANSTLFESVFIESLRERSMADVLNALDAHLAKHAHVAGAEFSVSDVAVGSYLLYIPKFFPDLDLSPWPRVVAYMGRMAARPACAATVAAE